MGARGRCALLSAALLATLAARAGAGSTADQGKADFTALCAPCHGDDARGDGPQAPHLRKKPADLTTITARYGRFPEDRIFETIAGLDMPDGHGSREMPVWGDVFISEGVGTSTKLEDAMKASDDASRRIAALVRYVESIQAPP
jgi:mono/diheme cytochrome c family protein